MPYRKELPPNLETYIQSKQLVTMEELLTIYEWPEKLLVKELKISFTTKVEKLNYPDGEFWQSKMPIEITKSDHLYEVYRSFILN